MDKLQISVLIRPDTYDHIRKYALSNKAYGAYIDQLVQEKRHSWVTLEEINQKLNKLIQATTNK